MPTTENRQRRLNGEFFINNAVCSTKMMQLPQFRIQTWHLLQIKTQVNRQVFNSALEIAKTNLKKAFKNLWEILIALVYLGSNLSWEVSARKALAIRKKTSSLEKVHFLRGPICHTIKVYFARLETRIFQQTFLKRTVWVISTGLKTIKKVSKHCSQSNSYKLVHVLLKTLEKA